MLYKYILSSNEEVVGVGVEVGGRSLGRLSFRVLQGRLCSLSLEEERIVYVSAHNTVSEHIVKNKMCILTCIV